MFEQLPDNRPHTSLAKIAAFLAATAGICFGLCSVGLFVGNTGTRSLHFLVYPASLSGIVVVLCLVSLFLLAIVFAISRIIEVFRHKDK